MGQHKAEREREIDRGRESPGDGASNRNIYIYILYCMFFLLKLVGSRGLVRVLCGSSARSCAGLMREAVG